MSAFDQGTAPVISVYNQAKTPLGLDLAALVAAMQTYVDDHVSPVWGTPCKLALTEGPVAGTWGMVFLDDADAPGALAYHDLDTGMPIAKVFVATTLNAHESLSVSASHELVEMLVDPAINLWAQAADGSLLAYETADPCEETSFEVSGFAMSDFVFPSYFEPWRQAGSVQFDYCKKLTKPWQIESGGYQIVMQGGNESQVTAVHGSPEKAARFALEDRRGHRSEYRSRR